MAYLKHRIDATSPGKRLPVVRILREKPEQTDTRLYHRLLGGVQHHRTNYSLQAARSHDLR